MNLGKPDKPVKPDELINLVKLFNIYLLNFLNPNEPKNISRNHLGVGIIVDINYNKESIVVSCIILFII